MLRGAHINTTEDHASLPPSRSTGGSLFLNLDRFDGVDSIMRDDCSVAERLAAMPKSRDLARKDIRDCESAIKSIIFNTPPNGMSRGNSSGAR